MNISTPALYELVFAAALLLMAALSAVVVFGLRFLLRTWTSRWLKASVVHAANLPAVLIGFPIASRLLPLNDYLGMTNGGLANFWLACLVADGIRISRQRSTAPTGRFRSWQTTALMVLILVSGVASTRATALSADSKRALDSTRLGYSMVAGWRQRSPEREILAAMSANFRPEMNEIMERYLAKATAERAHQSGSQALPRFPFAEVNELLRQRRRDLARAPDAALVNLARTMPGMATALEDDKLHCDLLAASVSMEASYASQPADPASVKAIAAYMVAALTAARAGIDTPVKRTFPIKRSEELAARYSQEAPESQPTLSTMEGASSASCRMIASELRWIGGLPADDAAHALALGYSSPPKAP